jgi:aminoglycoside phosphotransferase (APT) family kinase protein
MQAAQLAALGRHLQAVLPEVMADQGGRLEAKKLEGGQSNPTFLLHTPSGRRLVLRKKPGIVKVNWGGYDRAFPPDDTRHLIGRAPP